MVSSTGHGHASLKRVHYASGQFAVANIITALQAKPGVEVSMKWLWLYLDHSRDRIIVPLMKGTANVSLSQKALSTASIQIPTLDEQRRIVDMIGALDDTIEAAIAQEQRMTALLDHLRDRPIPGEYVPVGSVLTSIDSGVSTKPVDGPGEQANLLTLGAIRPGIFRADLIKSVGAAQLPEKARLHDGDLLITRSNTPEHVGYVARARDVPENTFIPDLVWRLVPNHQIVTSEYLEHLLSSPTYRARVTGIASGTSQSMRKINKTNFSSLKISLPSLEFQEEYVSPLRDVAESRAQAEQTVQTLRDLRSNLLTALLSGEHEIPESYDELMEV